MSAPTSSQSTEPRTEPPHAEPHAERRTVVRAQEARQGVTGHNVRYVLGFGLAATIIAFGIIYFVYFT